MRVLFAALLTALLIAGCDGGDEIGNDIDPTPEDTAGRESTEFEPDDISAAEDAGLLLELYCDGAVSEAQRVGCLSHVTESEVCAQDTDGRRAAVNEYIEETGDDPC